MNDERLKAIDLICSYYEAFNNGDTQKMLSLLAEDISHDVNQGERRKGKSAFIEFCGHMDKCYTEKLENIVIMASEDGRRAAAEFIVNGIYKATDSGLPAAKGQKYKLPAGAFLDIENNKIKRVTTYYNLQDWIQQVKAA